MATTIGKHEGECQQWLYILPFQIKLVLLLRKKRTDIDSLSHQTVFVIEHQHSIQYIAWHTGDRH